MSKGSGYHLKVAEAILDDLAEGEKPDDLAAGLTQLAIAEALTGILELLTGVIGDRGSVVDVRIQGTTGI